MIYASYCYGMRGVNGAADRPILPVPDRRTALTVRLVKLALALIAAVNGICLTSAGRADADPAPCDDCVTSPASGTAAHSGNQITVAGYVYIAGQTIDIKAINLDTQTFETAAKATSTTSCSVWSSGSSPEGGASGRVVPTTLACPWSWTGVIPPQFWAPQ